MYVFISKNMLHLYCSVTLRPAEGSRVTLPAIQQSPDTLHFCYSQETLIYFTWPGLYKQFNYSEKL